VIAVAVQDDLVLVAHFHSICVKRCNTSRIGQASHRDESGGHGGGEKVDTSGFTWEIMAQGEMCFMCTGHGLTIGYPNLNWVCRWRFVHQRNVGCDGKVIARCTGVDYRVQTRAVGWCCVIYAGDGRGAGVIATNSTRRIGIGVWRQRYF
jgi:hypothetical protein